MKNGFSDSFSFQKCILYTHYTYSLKVMALSIFQNFLVEMNFKCFTDSVWISNRFAKQAFPCENHTLCERLFQTLLQGVHGK